MSMNKFYTIVICIFLYSFLYHSSSEDVTATLTQHHVNSTDTNPTAVLMQIQPPEVIRTPPFYVMMFMFYVTIFYNTMIRCFLLKFS